VVLAVAAPAAGESSAAGREAGPRLYPVDGVAGKKGFIDGTGRVVIPPRFDWVLAFAEGLAAVSIDGKWGYVDERGEVVIAPRFDYADGFSEGLAPVTVGVERRFAEDIRMVVDVDRGKTGFIDRSGAFVIPPQFDAAGRFSQGLSAVRSGDVTRYIDPSGRPVIDFAAPDGLVAEARPFSEGRAAVGVARTFGCLVRGERSPSLEVEVAARSSADGLRRQQECEGKGPAATWRPVVRWGFVDLEGRWVVAPTLDFVDDFSEGLAAAGRAERLGYLDTSGKWALEPAADRDDVRTLGGFSAGLAAIRVGGLWGFVDTAGRVVIEPRFDGVGPFAHGRARATTRGFSGYIDATGRLVVPQRFLSAGPFLGDLARVETHAGAWGWVDRDGKPVWEPIDPTTGERLPGDEAVGELPPGGELVDPRDGARYPTRLVGDHVWLGSNLAFAADPSWCYGGDPAQCEANGRLYSYAAAGAACPAGWHLPTDEDWQELEKALGIEPAELTESTGRGFGQAAELLVGGTSGFEVPLAGFRGVRGRFEEEGAMAMFWTASAAGRRVAWSRRIGTLDLGIGRPVASIDRVTMDERSALSVRCVRDDQEVPR
jgi:uncharacterized protein (TIGR02145 family)